MALQKQPVPISFTQGLDTKTDKYQLPLGKFEVLKNSVFGTTGRLTKRNGYDNDSELPNSEQTVLTTLNDNLIATGSNLYTYSADTNQWIEQGKIQPVQLDVKSIVNNSNSQSVPDITLTADGLMAVVYMEGSNSFYQIVDSETSQQVVPRTQLPATATNPRVFKLGPYFIITFIREITATPTLQYIAVSTINPSAAGNPTTISSDVNSLDAGYDGYALNNLLFLAWGASASAVRVTFINQSLSIGTGATLSGNTADIMSVTVDTSLSRVYLAYWEESSQDGYSASFTYALAPAMDPTLIINNTDIRQISTIAKDEILNVYYETVNTYDYAPYASTDYVSKLQVTPPIGSGTGSVSSPEVVIRSVGIASKPFIAENESVYMMVAYGDMNQSPSQLSNQPSYFLIDDEGDIYSRLSYSNGGGYSARGNIPKIFSLEEMYYFPYEHTNFLTTVNKQTDIPENEPVNAIYTQQGVNLARFGLNIGDQYSAEIANSLHLTGGQLWQFDTVKPVEHSFHVWPENVAVSSVSQIGDMTAQVYFYAFTYEWTDNQGLLHRSAPSIPLRYEILEAPANFTADTTDTSNVLTNVSSFTGLQVGQVISGTGIPVDTQIVSLSPDTNEITISANATNTDTGVTITPTSISGVTINVPTLRLTAKIDNPVRIVGYRWSETQQIYYQFTSVTNPYINDTTIDSIEVSDTFSDEDILGQTLLYTTGGVLENIAAPPSIDSSLFDNRLWLIDAEDPNTLWYSKQVIQNVPVEFSGFLTLYVAPTTGAEGSTGPMRCVASMDDKLIIFKDNALYYINGNGPDNTGANNTYSQPIYITGVAGSNNPNSIALIPQGLMFQSNKGIWLLGRDLSTKYIGAPVESFNGIEILSAEVIPNTNQVRFILADGQTTLVYDYFYDQWDTHTNIRAISATIYQGLHTYLNSNGEIFKQNPETYKDGAEPVLMQVKLPWANLAGVQGFQRFYQMYLLGTYYTPFKLQIDIAYDYNPSPVQSIIVTPDNYTPDWGDEAVWGSGGAWGGPGDPFKARIFPEIQKCEAFQITITEVYDPSYGVDAGKGLSLSGINLIVGIKKGYRTQSSGRSFG